MIVSSVAVGVLALTTRHIDSLELKSYDFMLAVLRGPQPPPADIVIVAIDESSMKEFASSFRWPWPRSVHGELIRQLDAAGARAIVFDVVFDLPSQADEDEALASAIRASRAPVVLAATTEEVDDRQYRLTQQVRPLKLFVDAGARVGFAGIVPDVDGELRRVSLRATGGPTLAAAALAASGRHVDPAAVPAVGADGTFLVNYAGPARTIPTVSYYQAVTADHSLPAATFRGKTVLVGRSLAAQEISRGAEAQDLFATPFDLLMPGVEVHANAVNTAARGLFIRRASPALTWALLLVVGGLIAAVMTIVSRFRVKVLMALAVVALAPAIGTATFLCARYWLYTVQPFAIALAVFGLNALYQYRTSERDRAFVRKALTGYVSKPVMQRLLDNPSALELGGVQVDATVLFADIVGFSSIAERMTPHELTAALNGYFTTIGDVVMAHDGMIDKYIGDAIMAVWGAPLADPQHASKACAAALAMKAAIARHGGPLGARVGLNTGSMMAGNLGHRERMEYTVIGDSVNLASRLEGANKAYGSGILASEATWESARADFVFRRVDRIRVVGKQQPVAIYELLASRIDSRSIEELARVASFERLLDAYDRRDWTLALAVAAEHRASFAAADPVLDVYEERCRAFALNGPAADWDGVYALAAK